ncbi:MAG: hypothetical protein KDA52_12655 [Planctomycetaceae bacterium]|nr:hypothetical protein [Planctomycetaceae bacterium]
MLATRELIDNFHEYALRQVHNGAASLTIDELYKRWRLMQERNESIGDIRIAMEQFERGEGMTLDEAERRIRQQLNLPSRTI